MLMCYFLSALNTVRIPDWEGEALIQQYTKKETLSLSEEAFKKTSTYFHMFVCLFFICFYHICVYVMGNEQCKRKRRSDV